MNDSKGKTRVLLPDGASEARYDDTETPANYDETLAGELLAAAHRDQDRHAELAPGRPSLSAPGMHSPHVSFRVPAELAEQLDRQSEAEGVSGSTLARGALAAYLEAVDRQRASPGGDGTRLVRLDPWPSNPTRTAGVRCC